MGRRIRTLARAAGIIAAAIILAVAGCAGSPEGTQTPARTTIAMPTPKPTPTAEPDLAAPGTRRQALTFGGKQRTYVMHAPPGYRPGQRLPLVVVLHYRAGTGEKMRSMTRFDAKADAEGFLVAYPDAVRTGFNAFVCCGEEDDVAFIKALVAHLQRLWGVDSNRVYATGISNGADMSVKLAIELPGTFAAIAPVSGGYVGARALQDKTYVPTRPTSMVSIIGAHDRLYNRLEEGLSLWRERLDCPAAKASAPAPGVAKTAARCADGSEVVAYAVAEMGHAWPGGVRGEELAEADAAVSATDAIWAFFATHPRG